MVGATACSGAHRALCEGGGHKRVDSAASRSDVEARRLGQVVAFVGAALLQQAMAEMTAGDGRNDGSNYREQAEGGSHREQRS